MKIISTSLSSLVVLAMAVSTTEAAFTFQNGVNGYSSTADTWIAIAGGSGSGDETGTNYGGNTSLKVEVDPNQSNGQGLIRFDSIFGNGPGQIALGSTITSATLSMTTVDGGFAAVPSSPSIHRMQVAWVEGSVTWSTFDAGITTGMSAGSDYNTTFDDGGGANLANGDVGTWNVTASLAAWSAGGTNNGWAFIGTTDNGWDAYTSEFGTVGSRPLLTVEVVPEPSTTALLGLGGLALILRRRK